MTAPEPTTAEGRWVVLAEKVASSIREREGRSPLPDFENFLWKREVHNVAEWIATIEAAGLAVVDLSEPDEVHETGNFVTARFGPVEIRSDGFLRRMDSLGYTARERAVYLLAAAAWAERQGGDPR